MAKTQVIKVSWWMERLADYMIANPHCTLGEIAKALDKTPAWISTVKHSDVFKDYWAIRSRGHSDAVTTNIKDKAYAACELALDHVIEKLEIEKPIMSIDTALQVIDTTMKRLGYDNEKDKAPLLNINLGTVTPEQLADARAKLRERADKVIEHQYPGTELVVEDTVS